MLEKSTYLRFCNRLSGKHLVNAVIIITVDQLLLKALSLNTNELFGHVLIIINLYHEMIENKLNIKKNIFKSGATESTTKNSLGKQLIEMEKLCS